jgi:hypothetical protein
VDFGFNEEDAEIADLKRQVNRWRSKTRKLRHEQKLKQQESDELFMTLCADEFEKYFEAKEQFERLWACGDFGCGPEDYEELVTRSLEAIGITRFIAAIANHETELFEALDDGN